MRLELEITHRCNKNCRLCGRRPESSSYDGLTREQYRQIASIAVPQFRWALLTGGEPLVHPNFHWLATQALADFARVDVATNGRLLPQLKEDDPGLYQRISWTVQEYPGWNDDVVAELGADPNVTIRSWQGFWDPYEDPGIDQWTARWVAGRCQRHIRVVGTRLYRCCLSEAVERHYQTETAHVEFTENWREDWENLPVWRACQHCTKARDVLRDEGRGNRMRVLVTGHRGKLGGKVRELLGDQAKGYDLRDGQDILDSATLVGAMDGCEVVVHCAGIPHPNAGTFADYTRTNVWGTMNICQAAQALKVRRVVYFSSTAWYGCNASGGFEPLELPVIESHRPRPGGTVSAYGTSKRLAEEVLRWYGTQGLVETVILRSAPANPKSGQYPEGFDWRSCDDYRRKSLWANCHPDYAAGAAVLAVRHAGPFWGEVFNLCDRYVPDCIDLTEFLLAEYPDLRKTVLFRSHEGWSLFDTTRAQEVLAWEPCDER